jgi:hypothetical protein
MWTCSGCRGSTPSKGCYGYSVSDFEECLENAERRFKNAHPDEINWQIDWEYVQVKGYKVTLTGPLDSKSIGVAKGLGDMTGCILKALESLRNAIVSAPPPKT